MNCTARLEGSATYSRACLFVVSVLKLHACIILVFRKGGFFCLNWFTSFIMFSPSHPITNLLYNKSTALFQFQECECNLSPLPIVMEHKSMSIYTTFSSNDPSPSSILSSFFLSSSLLLRLSWLHSPTKMQGVQVNRCSFIYIYIGREMQKRVEGKPECFQTEKKKW